MLIEKYYAGETTHEEEQQINKWLEENQAPEFDGERSQFKYFQKARNATIPQDFLEKFEKAILNSQSERKNPLKWAIGIAASIILLISIYFLANLTNPSTEIQQLSLANNVTEVPLEITLEDGTKLWLNKESSLQYPEAFDRDRRWVTLSGEAYFQVSPDPQRPFVIQTESSNTEVIGTSFNIRNYHHEPVVEVWVESGKVAFSSVKDQLQEKVFINSGEMVSFDKRANSISKRKIGNQNHLAWKTGKLVFQDVPLDEVFDVLSENFNIRFLVKNDALLNCHFIGTFDNEKLEDILQLISFSMNITFDMNNEGYVIEGEGCK